MANPEIKASGNIAIVWGTPSALGNMSGIVLETLSITPKNGTPIDIEDGAGLAAIQVMLNDGFDAKATVVYDSNKALPAVKEAIILVAPNTGASGTANYNCTFWSWGFTRSRKKEAMVELTFTRRPNIDG
jgi:hypothetical protein